MAGRTAWAGAVPGWIAKHPFAGAAGFGAIAALGFQPLAWWPLTLVGIAGLLWQLRQVQGLRAAAARAWWFGLAHFAVGINWIATAFTYQAKMPAWLGWIAVVLIACVLALFPALAAAAGWALHRRVGAHPTLAFAGCWIVAEWLRSWVLTGFAWNPLSAVLLGGYDNPGLARLLPWTGTYALSALVILLGGGVGTVIDRRRPRRQRWMAAAVLTATTMIMLVPAARRAAPSKVPVTVVQPNVPQAQLNDPAFYSANFARVAAQSRPLTALPHRLLIWPESGVADYLRDGYPAWFYAQNFGADPALARQRIGRVIGPGGLVLTGAIDLELRGGEAVAARNVMTAVDAAGTIRGGYAKAHLVPGGEYLPLRAILEPLGLSRLVPGAIDFLPGPGPRTLDLGPWGRAGIQICYEIIFSGQITDRGNRPDYIVNPSNDGWYGVWGPPQHLAQTRLRAIEEGLPVLRSTTTGISAVIAADGVVEAAIPLNRAGRIDRLIPAAAPPTLFARTGNALALCWAMVFLALSLVASRLRRS